MWFQKQLTLWGLYSLPELEEGKERELIESLSDSSRIAVVKGDEIHPLDLNTGLGAGRYINEALEDDVRICYIPGALTESIIKAIEPEKFKRVKFVLKDPTKIFIDAINWKQLAKKGFKVEVLKNIKVAAVTVNPFAPAGYSFDSDALLSEMKKLITDIPVIDVRK